MKSTKQLGRVIMCLGTLLSVYGLLLILRNAYFPPAMNFSYLNASNPFAGLQHFFCAICIIAIGFLTYERRPAKD